MSKKFYAVHRETGERWKPSTKYKQYLIMYDSGFLAVVSEDYYTYIKALCPATWKCVRRD